MSSAILEDKGCYLKLAWQCLWLTFSSKTNVGRLQKRLTCKVNTINESTTFLCDYNWVRWYSIVNLMVYPWIVKLYRTKFNRYNYANSLSGCKICSAGMHSQFVLPVSWQTDTYALGRALLMKVTTSIDTGHTAIKVINTNTTVTVMECSVVNEESTVLSVTQSTVLSQAFVLCIII